MEFAPRIEETVGRRAGAMEPSPARCPACLAGHVEDLVEVPDHEYGLDQRGCYSCCGACRTLYQSPMPGEDQLASYYRGDYHSLNDGGVLMSLRNQLRARRLRPILGGSSGAVLDFGCGNGSFIKSAANSYPDVEFFGFEIGERRKVLRPGKRVTIVQGRIEDLLDVLPRCQAVLMNHVIEHLPDPLATVSALADKLSPGGWMDGQTPNAASLEHRIFGRRWSGFHAPRHTVVFSTAGLKALLERAGFEAVHIRGAFNPAGYAVSFASLSHGDRKGTIQRHGWKWLFFLSAAAVALPLDLSSGAPGIVDFRARKKAR